MSPSKKTSLIVEIPENQGTNIDENQQNEFIDRTVKEIIKKGFINKKNIISTKLINIPYAYPIIEKGIELKLDNVFKYFRKKRAISVYTYT
jgi:protoporphyrinogen oxidase